MEKLLFEASLEGSVSSLLGLLREDPLILDRYTILNPYNETPLHVATMLGHLDFVREILKRKPELATELNSRRSSALHLASAKGYVGIVKELLLVSPDMCLASDRDGWNPVHLAAMKGRIDVLKELLRVSVHAARALVHRGETVLHLCVKHNQVEALKLLVETLRDHEFVNSKDDDGHTILDIAVTDKQIESGEYTYALYFQGGFLEVTVKFLLQNTSIEVNETNRDGVTAIEENRNNSVQNHTQSSVSILESAPGSEKKTVPEKQEKWLEDNRNTLMVVASLLATMAFQVGVNPPGGVWQEFENITNSSVISPFTKSSVIFPFTKNYRHIPGTSIMAELYSEQYIKLTITNTVSLISSLSIILLLISGIPIKRRIFMNILMVIMWIAATTTTFTFLFSLVALAPNKGSSWLYRVILMVLSVWMVLMGILILVHIIRLIIKSVSKLINSHSQRRRRRSRFTTNHGGV